MNRSTSSRGIVEVFRKHVTAGRYATVSPAARWRVDLTSLGLAVCTALILFAEGERWLVIPIGLFFFVTGRMFGLDAVPLLTFPQRAWRRARQPSNEDATQAIDERLLNALLTPDDVGEAWTQSPPLPGDGAISIPCSAYSMLGWNDIADSVVVRLHPQVPGSTSEGVRQTIVVAKSTEVATRRFQAARSAFGCSQWLLPDVTFEVERLALLTGDAEAVAFRLENHSSPREPGPPWIIHGVVFRNGRIIVDVRHHARSVEPDLSLTQTLVARARKKAAALAPSLPVEELAPDPTPPAHSHDDLEPYFSTDEFPDYVVLETRRAPAPIPDSKDAFHATTFAMSTGYLYGEQRLFESHLDFYSLEVTSGRYASPEEASGALQRDAGEYAKQEYYGVRSIRIPTIGDESAAAAGRVSLGPRGTRVACVWFRREAVVTRYQGFANAADPLPVVQTIAESIARRVS